MLRRDAAKLGLLLLLSGCAGPGREIGAAKDRILLAYEEVAAPEAFAIAAPAEPTTSPTPGLWAAVPGLPRAELGAIRNLQSGARIRAALFEASGDVVRLSASVAEALGIAPGTRAEVEIVALRRQPRLVGHEDAF